MAGNMRFLSRGTRILNGLNRHILRACEWATIGLVATIMVIVCAGVFWRYVLNDSLSWSEESAKFLMVWLVFAAAPIALAQGAHVAIDTLVEALPGRARNLLLVLIHLIILSFLYLPITEGYGFALNARGQATPTTGISMMVIFAAMPIGGVLLACVALERLAHCVQWTIDPAMQSGSLDEYRSHDEKSLHDSP